MTLNFNVNLAFRLPNFFPLPSRANWALNLNYFIDLKDGGRLANAKKNLSCFFLFKVKRKLSILSHSSDFVTLQHTKWDGRYSKGQGQG